MNFFSPHSHDHNHSLSHSHFTSYSPSHHISVEEGGDAPTAHYPIAIVEPKPEDPAPDRKNAV